jgi:hypothetical protein
MGRIATGTTSFLGRKTLSQMMTSISKRITATRIMIILLKLKMIVYKLPTFISIKKYGI